MWESIERKIEYKRNLKKVNQMAESEQDKENLGRVLNRLMEIEDRFSKALDSQSFKTKFHPTFMTQDEYNDLYLIGQEFRQLRFTESSYLNRLFPDKKKLKEIEFWMERNQPDYIPFPDFF